MQIVKREEVQRVQGVFNKKGWSLGSGVRFKAKLVVKAYAQREGNNYNEVFSPVMKHISIQVLLAIWRTLILNLNNSTSKLPSCMGI